MYIIISKIEIKNIKDFKTKKGKNQFLMKEPKDSFLMSSSPFPELALLIYYYKNEQMSFDLG
jgi:hypothetical protein